MIFLPPLVGYPSGKEKDLFVLSSEVRTEDVHHP